MWRLRTCQSSVVLNPGLHNCLGAGKAGLLDPPSQCDSVSLWWAPISACPSNSQVKLLLLLVWKHIGEPPLRRGTSSAFVSRSEKSVQVAMQSSRASGGVRSQSVHSRPGPVGTSGFPLGAAEVSTCRGSRVGGVAGAWAGRRRRARSIEGFIAECPVAAMIRPYLYLPSVSHAAQGSS